MVRFISLYLSLSGTEEIWNSSEVLTLLYKYSDMTCFCVTLHFSLGLTNLEYSPGLKHWHKIFRVLTPVNILSCCLDFTRNFWQDATAWVKRQFSYLGRIKTSSEMGDIHNPPDQCQGYPTAFWMAMNWILNSGCLFSYSHFA